MPTIAPTAQATTRVAVTSRRPTEFLDITDRIASWTTAIGLRQGFVNVQSLHTTLAIVVNEHEPLLLQDFADWLERLAPANHRYRHDDHRVRTVNLNPGERDNGHAHCRALLLPTSTCLNVAEGALMLGRWQRVFAVELDGPRRREVSLSAVRGELR